MGKKSSSLFRTAREILRKDGAGIMISRGLVYLAHRLFQYATFYVYEHSMKERNETDLLPSLQNLTVKIVSSNEEANKLAGEGLDFRQYVFNAGKALDSGAIAFCMFAGKDLACIGWLAMDREAKKYIDPLPFHVNFPTEACTGGTRTVKKYRGAGLMTYNYYLRLDYLRKMGVRTSRASVAVSNVASQRVHAKFGPRVIARARYIKLLKYEDWKETPVKGIK